jgi:TolB-like protein/Tfp pilus assembly protein PilF
VPVVASHLSAALSDRYRIERELGAGGMATVYLAHDLKHDRPVAIKVLKPELGAVIGAERFLAEIKVTANLQHPNLLPLFDSGEAAGLLYYVMPFVEGETLRARIEREKQLPVDDVMRLATLMAGALDYAHARNVIHRDLKPENILLQAGQPVIADFGIALAVANAGGSRITETGLSLGTPHYMSPEQASGDRTLDARSDQYSLGAVAYEMLTGEPPHTGATAQAIIVRLMTETPRSIRATRPAVPPTMDLAVGRTLSKAPADRFASCGDFARALSQTAASGAAAATSDAASRAARVTRPLRPIHLVLSLTGVAVVALAAWLLLRQAPASAATPKSLAVLPFETVGADTANAYFAEGIADELTTALSHVPGLRLAGKRSAARFSGRTSTVQEIGKALNVASVLEGSVRRADSRVRVNAELTDASDGVVIWSDSYERDARDVFKVQDDIANAIAGALRVRLSGGLASGTSAARGTSDLEAYDLYLRGLYLFRRRGPGLVQAREYFEQAIARDSTFGRAYAALVSTLLTTPYFLPVRMGEMLPPARAAAERALALDPNLAESHVAMGFVYAESFEWPEAEAEYQQAIALDPASAEPLYRMGNLLLVTGRAVEAVTVLEGVRTRDPLYAVAASYLAWAYAAVGRNDDAIAEGRRALELEPKGLPQLGILATIYNSARQQDSAVALARRLLSLTDSPYRIGGAARTLAIGGQVAEARALTAKVEAVPIGTWGRESALAHAWMGLGDTTRALAAMERAASGDGDLFYSSFAQLFLSGKMEPLRGNTRLLAVMKRYNLEPERFFPAPPK